jgi:hypothetical protein
VGLIPPAEEAAPRARLRSALGSGIPAAVATAALAVALARARPPAPLSADAPSSSFSADRAAAHVRWIAARPHPRGSAAQVEVLARLERELAGLGLAVESQPVGPRARNLIARLPGRASTGAVLLVAHADSVPTGPGAGDDGAAVAAALETLRALRAGPPLRNDVRVLLTDAEEMGLVGARAFVADEERLRDVRLVLNFDARGNAGPVLMFQTDGGNDRLVAEYADAAPVPGANSLMEAIYRRMPNDTDFTMFQGRGLAGMNFALIEGYRAYHGPADTPEALSRASLQHVGETMLALARRFGDADLRDLGGGDAVYFDVLGAGVVRYPPGLAIPLAIATAAGFAWALARRRRRAPVRRAGVAVGVVASALAVLVAGLVAFALSRAVIGAFEGSLSRPAVGTAGDPWLFVGMAAAALAVVATLARLVDRWFGDGHFLLGAGGLGLVLLFAAAAGFPEGSFVVQWPVAGLLAALVASPAGPARPGPLASSLGALPAVLVLGPLCQRLFVGMTLDKAAVAAAATGLALTLLVPLVATPAAGRRPRLALAAAVAAVVATAIGVVRA